MNLKISICFKKIYKVAVMITMLIGLEGLALADLRETNFRYTSAEKKKDFIRTLRQQLKDSTQSTHFLKIPKDKINEIKRLNNSKHLARNLSELKKLNKNVTNKMTQTDSITLQSSAGKKSNDEKKELTFLKELQQSLEKTNSSEPDSPIRKRTRN